MPRVSKHELWSAVWNAKVALDKAAGLVDTWLEQDEEDRESIMNQPHKKKKKPKK